MSDHYSTYYERNEIEAWRRLGGIDKANHVRVLWGTRPPPRVVDVGCGDGAVAEALTSNFWATYIGFDISSSAVEAGRRKEIPGAEFALFDGSSLPLEDQSCDVALLSHVLEHVEDPRSLLTECARVARRVLIEVPLELNLRTPRDFVWTDVGHINLFNLKLLRHLVQSCGLTVEQERIYCPSRAQSIFRKGWAAGSAVWALKASLLRLNPRLATTLLTYHGGLIARSPGTAP